MSAITIPVVSETDGKNPANINSHRFFFTPKDIALMTEDTGKFSMLAEMGGAQGLAAAFRTNLRTGLYSDEVEEGLFLKRREVYGKNEYPVPPLKPFWVHCWEAFTDEMLLILSTAGLISIITGAIAEPAHGWYEGVAILMAVVCVTLVGGGNNYHQELQFRKLDEEKEPPTSSIRRRNKPDHILQSEVNVGDLVVLAAGDFIPCDGIIITDAPIKCDESRMTGESRDVVKNFYEPFLKAGTAVREGECLMLAVAVGVNTEYGRLMASLAEERKDTPLQEKLEAVAALIGKIGFGVAGVLFVTLMIWWAVDISHHDKSWGKEAPAVLDFFIIAVTVVVVAVPEGLPLAVTISFAYSMKKMYKDKNLVRVLSACETMGNATTICSDKTGTLTQNLMTVVEVYLGTRYFGKGKIPETDQISEPVKRLLIEGVVVNSKTYIDKKDMIAGQKPEQWAWKDGNQTEQSLMAWLVRYDIDVDNERSRILVSKKLPFDSTVKRSSVIIKYTTGYRQYFKGAPEAIIDMCDKTIDEKGEETEMKGDTMGPKVEGLAKQGLRTIAFGYIDYAHLDLDENQLPIEPPNPTGCTFVGLVGIKDPLRPESRDSVRACQRAGIVVRMVTGDHPQTARFIAKECGIITDDDWHLAMTGKDFREMLESDRSRLEALLPRLRVLARSRPEDKEKLVKLLQSLGEVVAVTGDGTNDAPALKSADVGIAMFLTGTDVAKMAAQIQILDDNFHSIVKSVMWGRSVFDNIRKFVQFQLTINMVALTITLIGAFSGKTNPLKAVQLLWVNLIMDTMAALALGTEQPTMKLLERRPYSRNASLISPVMWRNIVVQGCFQLFVLLTLLFTGHMYFDVKQDSIHHYTLIFNTFVFLQIFNEINSRKVNDEMNVVERFFENSIFSVIIIVTVIMQTFMVELFGVFAETHSLTAGQWFATMGLGALSLPVGVLARMVKVNYDSGRIEIAPDTFKGANLYDDDAPSSGTDGGGGGGDEEMGTGRGAVHLSSKLS